jgi:hypothetical protein
VTISTPIASPSHQTSHAEVNPDQARTCVKRSVVAPAEAAIIGAVAAPYAITPKTSRSRSKEGLSFMKRRTRYPPIKALDVLPTAIPKHDNVGIGLRKFMKNAPKASPGQTS